MADTIQLRGLRALGRHGVGADEQSRAQPFEVDLDVEADLSTAARTDEVSDTVDYGALSELVASVITDERHALLERIADRVVEVVMADARVSAVKVTVRKLRPPVPVDLDTAAVCITRQRA